MSSPADSARHSGSRASLQYRADIDGLRAIAVLCVVGFHAFPDRFQGGFIGVDIFFVISGFLISTIILDGLENNTFSFVGFYGRRIRRIFPALLLILLASLAFGWFALLADEYRQLGKQVAGGAGFVANFVLWAESGYFDASAETKPLLHLWSLGIEEQFYIAWPLALWFAHRRRWNLLTVTLALGAVSFLLNLGSVQRAAVTSSVASFYSPQTRFWELLAGSVLACIAQGRQQVFPGFWPRLARLFPFRTLAALPAASALSADCGRNLRSIVGTALIGAGLLLVTKEHRFPGWWAGLPVAGSALLISAGARAWLNRTVLSHPVLVWCGLISYPLYLWHWPLLSFARIVQGALPPPWIRLAAVAVSIVLAWLTYRLVEKPIRLGARGGAKTTVLLLSMGAVAYVGYDCYDRGGYGFRFPGVVQELAQYKYDYTAAYRAGSCFLLPEQDFSVFNTCAKPSGQKKSILLWGDSHAAHLYPGYAATYGATHEIVQRTASLCPPILGMEIDGRPHCKKINDYIFESIKKERPGKIVLAAAWTSYDWQKIAGTIGQLREIGAADIDLIGPVPQWVDGLPKQLYLEYRSDKFHRVPERMKAGLNQNFMELDPLLSDFSKRLKVRYISPAKILCNEDGCITRYGKTGDTLAAWDYAHLTETSSHFLVSQFPRD